MGAIVISQVKTYGKQVQAFEVIDGQQRLTTFQLLLIAFKRVSAKYDPLYSEEVSKYIFNSGIMENSAIEQFKLWPSQVDRPAFKAIALTEDQLQQEDTVSTAVLAEAFFFSRIEAFAKSENAFDSFRLEKFFEALKSGLAVVSIELESHDDPQTIFETLNSRGVDLTVGDLVRNFIFQSAVGLGQSQGVLTIDALYEKYWLPLDGWFWKETLTRGRLNKPRLDWLLSDHLTMCKAEIISSEDLYDTYRRWIINIKPFFSVKEELEDITLSAKTVKAVARVDQNDPLGRFGKFSSAFDVSTTMPLVLYLAKFLSEEQLVECLSQIETYVLRRDICGLPTGSYNRFFIDAIKHLRQGEKSSGALRAFLASGDMDTNSWPSDETFEAAWISRAQYKSAR